MALQKTAAIAGIIGLIISVITLFSSRELREDLTKYFFDVEKSELWERDSGWMGGGSSPSKYCSSVRKARLQQYPNRVVEVNIITYQLSSINVIESRK